MRQALAFAAVAVAASLAAVAGAGAAGRETAVKVSLTHVNDFPLRRLAVSLPEGVERPRVRVRENGEPVSRVAVTPAVTGAGSAVVIVVDASNSMRGRPIRGAMAAARAFAKRRSVGQRLGVVAFNRRARVLLRPTSDAEAVRVALGSAPPLASETHIYDAVGLAVRLLREARVQSGSVVLLSDGSDTGSRNRAEATAARARDAGYRVFTVGLRSSSYRAGPLASLAAATGARFAEAATAEQLAPLFDRLGYELAHEYVVTYRSLLGPETRARVTVDVAGVGRGTATYRTPALPPLPPPVIQESAADRIWRSPLLMLLVAAVAASLLGLAAVLVFRPRNRALQRRMSEFVTLGNRPRDPSHRLPGLVFGTTERSLERTPWWARFNEKLEVADVRVPAVQIVLWTVVASIVAMWVGAVLLGPVGLVLGLAPPFAARGLVDAKLRRRQTQFADQLPDNLQVLASALRAGHSLVGALSVVVADAPEPARAELQRVVADEQLGVPLDDAFMRAARRMECRDLEQVALVAALGRDTGGNTAEVLDRVTETIRERFELRRLVRTLTAQGRASRWVVSLLPVALLGMITMLNPNYIHPLFTHTAGRIALALAAAMVVAGSLVIRRIVEIKV